MTITLHVTRHEYCATNFQEAITTKCSVNEDMFVDCVDAFDNSIFKTWKQTPAFLLTREHWYTSNIRNAYPQILDTVCDGPNSTTNTTYSNAKPILILHIFRLQSTVIFNSMWTGVCFDMLFYTLQQ